MVNKRSIRTNLCFAEIYSLVQGAENNSLIKQKTLKELSGSPVSLGLKNEGDCVLGCGMGHRREKDFTRAEHRSCWITQATGVSATGPHHCDVRVPKEALRELLAQSL